jgi:hypothetical protein
VWEHWEKPEVRRWTKCASRPRVSAEGGYEERPEEVGMTSASCTRDWQSFLIWAG